MAELGRIRRNWDVIVATNLFTSIDIRLGILNKKSWAMVTRPSRPLMNRNRLLSEVAKTFYFIFFKKVAEYGRFTPGI